MTWGNWQVEKLWLMKGIHFSINSRPWSWKASARGILWYGYCTVQGIAKTSTTSTHRSFVEAAFLIVLIDRNIERPCQGRSVVLHHGHHTQEYSNSCPGTVVLILQGRVTWAGESPDSSSHSSCSTNAVSQLQTPSPVPSGSWFMLVVVKPS